MATKFRLKRSFYLNIALLMVLVVVWCISYAKPVFQSIYQLYKNDCPEYLFYGRLSYAAVPSFFGGSGIPFLDKTYFRINGDNKATFVLYASESMYKSMSDWFSFSAINAGDVPIEIRAIRLLDNRYVVRSMESTLGSLDWATVVFYQLKWSLIVMGIITVCFFVFLYCIISAIRLK